MMIGRRGLVALGLASGLMLAACGPSRPGDRAARHVLEYIYTLQPGTFKVLRAHKTNAREMNNGQVYVLEYEATLRCLKDYQESWLEAGSNRRSCKAGGTLTKSGSLLFSKTEKGWQGMDGKLY